MATPPEPPSPPHKRRTRYTGTHPRRFEERYKEHDAERYPDIVPHVLAKGRTPAGQHVPILVEEVLGVLAPAAGERAVDCTLGYGGHAHRILERLHPGGTLMGMDADPLELPRTEARLRKLGHDERTFLARRSNFAGLLSVLAGAGWTDGADVLLADLGVSSMQLDDPARGFTFAADGPLDMRMNPSRGLSAAQWLERQDQARLTEVLAENADEPHAERIAEALTSARGRVATTRELAELVRHALARSASEDEAERSVRRVFQALRIEVNDEFAALDVLLRSLPLALRAGGRVAILSFHSGEDRRVKQAFRAGKRAGVYAAIAPDVIRASAQERHENPRSGPAKLRWARRASTANGGGGPAVG
jgi:16S rRNA (cytosine1402-N4)-methyltransferase